MRDSICRPDTKWILLVALLVLATGLAGCTGTTDSGTPTADTANSDDNVKGDDDRTQSRFTDQTFETGITRIVMEEDHVVCYVYRDDANGMAVGGTGGLSCLPMGQVDTDE